MIRYLLAAFLAFVGPAWGADTKISGLPAASALTGVEQLPCVQSAATKKCTVTQAVTFTYSLLSGDCTATSGGAITCLKSNGVAFAALAFKTQASLTADVSGLLPIANGGTATATPAIVAGTNTTVSGSWPNQTINSVWPTQTQIETILNPSQTITPASGLFFPLNQDVAWSPSASTAISFADMGRMTLSGVSGLTGTGHAGGLLGWVVNNNTGTIPLVIAVEGKFENDNAGTITTAFGNDSNLTASNGPITNYFAYPIQTSNITAAITNFYGFYFPALVGTTGNTVAPTNIYAFANIEPAATIFTVGPTLSTSTATYSLDVSTSTHFNSKSAVPTISTCGTTPPVATASSSNGAGQFTLGTGTPTACTVTFANAYNTMAFCTVTPATAYTGTYYVSAQSAAAFTVTLGTGTNSVKFNYSCGGQ